MASRVNNKLCTWHLAAHPVAAVVHTAARATAACTRGTCNSSNSEGAQSSTLNSSIHRSGTCNSSNTPAELHLHLTAIS